MKPAVPPPGHRPAGRPPLAVVLRSLLFNALFFSLTALCCLSGILLLPLPRRLLRRYVQGWASQTMVS